MGRVIQPLIDCFFQNHPLGLSLRPLSKAFPPPPVLAVYRRLREIPQEVGRRQPKIRRKMKIRSVVTLIGLTISFALPASAQQTNQSDRNYVNGLSVASKAHTDALDKNDAAAVAANFTEEAVSVEQDGTNFGREAIQKVWADRILKVHFSNNVATVDEDSPHVIGTDGKLMWATGAWSATIKGDNWGPTEIKGFWLVIREGPDWNIRMLTSNVTPTSANRGWIIRKGPKT